jgi:transcriptional regulator with XRE-family HTH domain
MADKAELGRKLRAIRKSKNLSGSSLAELLNINQSTISRIESGRLKPEIDFIRSFSKATKLSKMESEELIEFSENFLLEFDRWHCERRGTVPRLQKLALDRERSASLLETYSAEIVPGLLQTSQYMNSLFKMFGEKDPKAREKAISLRTQRQYEMLKSNSKSKFRFLISEKAFSLGIFDSASLSLQLKAIWEIQQKYHEKNIEIRILSLKKCNAHFPQNAFTVYDRKFVTIETLTRGITIWSSDEVKEYVTLFDYLFDVGQPLSGKYLRAR